MKKNILLIAILFSIRGTSCNHKTVHNNMEKKELSATDIDTIARYAVKKYGASFIYYDICNFEINFDSNTADYNPTTEETEKVVNISKDILTNYISMDDVDFDKHGIKSDMFSAFYIASLFIVKDGYELGKENSR